VSDAPGLLRVIGGRRGDEDEIAAAVTAFTRLALFAVAVAETEETTSLGPVAALCEDAADAIESLLALVARLDPGGLGQLVADELARAAV
jgi:hypothetical protein